MSKVGSTQPQAGTVPEGVPLTISEKLALKGMMERCWNFPDGAERAEELVVSLRILLLPDGYVDSIQTLDSGAGLSNRRWRTAVEEAHRAVYQCAPYRLPEEKYQEWREIRLTLDPSRLP